MIATSAKLRELVEGYNPASSIRTNESLEARDQLWNAAPALARLVLTLSEALNHEMLRGAEAAPVQDTDGRCFNCELVDKHTTWCGWGALAAAEKLEL